MSSILENQFNSFIKFTKKFIGFLWLNLKIVIGVIVIAIFVIVGSISFMDNEIEYVDFKDAQNISKTVQVKGNWVKEKESKFDVNTNTFTFYMRDDNNNEMKVVLDGAKPNNFEVADAIVAKGKVEDGYFHAKSVLTKCPSKYEGKGEDVQKTDM
jgi:cytochrome c-type biogenesis protein CcmE